MKRLVGSILAGAAIAAIVACGGAKPAGSRAPGAHSDGAVAPIGKHDQRIVDIDALIDADMQALGTPRPPAIAPTCGNPPCAITMAVQPKPTTDPKCVRSEAQVCTDNCKLADSICENAEKICKIAGELVGDTWASEKCTSAGASCDTARGKCCGCT